MTKYTLIIMMAFALSGCAALTKPDGIFYGYGQQKKLAGAVTLLEEGKTSAAAKLLSALCDEKGVPGVTDEALFRLSLLRLESAQERNGVVQAQHDLERLQKEYPTSSWAPLASSLTGFLASADDMRQQDRKLKESNLSLIKENRELHQNIEKLKNLELEMGRGGKH